MLARASKLGVRHCEMGMAHRGRLNVIHNVFDKPLRDILDDFGESGNGAFLLMIKGYISVRLEKRFLDLEIKYSFFLLQIRPILRLSMG